MTMEGDTPGPVDAKRPVVGASGPSRVWVRSGSRVLYSPFQYRKRNSQPSDSSSSSASGDVPEDEDEDEDEEEFYTPDQGHSLDMDMYSSDVGGYSGDSHMSSEVDDDMDFYAVESSQPPVTVNAVRSPTLSLLARYIDQSLTQALTAIYTCIDHDG